MDAKPSLPEIKLSGADKDTRMPYKGYDISGGSKGLVCKNWFTEVLSPSNRERQT